MKTFTEVYSCSSVRVSLLTSKKKLREIPQLSARCNTQASAYAACVSDKKDIKQNDCMKEFQALKECMEKWRERF